MRFWSARTLSYASVVCAGLMLAGVTFLLATNWWVHRQGHVFRSYDALTDVPAREFAIVPGVGDRNGAIGNRLRNRLLSGLSLYRAHKVSAILVSGVGGDPGSGDEVSSAYGWLVAHGVPPAHIVTDPAGFRTLDTMQRAAKTFGVRSAIVCSQRQHIDRTLFLAHAAGIDAVGFLSRQSDTLTNYEIRLETLKATLAFTDTYLLRRGPRVTGPVGLVASTP